MRKHVERATQKYNEIPAWIRSIVVILGVVSSSIGLIVAYTNGVIAIARLEEKVVRMEAVAPDAVVQGERLARLEAGQGELLRRLDILNNAIVRVEERIFNERRRTALENE